jgi:hypothetical protein
MPTSPMKRLGIDHGCFWKSGFPDQDFDKQSHIAARKGRFHRLFFGIHSIGNDAFTGSHVGFIDVFAPHGFIASPL